MGTRPGQSRLRRADCGRPGRRSSNREGRGSGRRTSARPDQIRRRPGDGARGRLTTFCPSRALLFGVQRPPARWQWHGSAASSARSNRASVRSLCRFSSLIGSTHSGRSLPRTLGRCGDGPNAKGSPLLGTPVEMPIALPSRSLNFPRYGR